MVGVVDVRGLFTSWMGGMKCMHVWCIVLLYYCIIVLLYYCIIVLLYYRIIVLLYLDVRSTGDRDRA